MSPDPVSPAPGSRRWCEECGPEPGVAYHEPCGGRGCDGCDNSGTVTCTCLKAAPGSPPSREDLLAALSDAQFSTPYWMKVTHGRLRWLRDQLPALLDAQAALADARAECEELQRHRTVHVDENRSLRATVAELRAALADAKKRIERFETYCETPHCAIIMRHEGPCVLTEAGYALLEHAAFEACADAQREAERLRADAKERRCISCGQELPVPPTRCDGCLEKRLHELIVELGDSHSAFAALHSELRASDRQRREPAEEAGPSGAKPI